MKPNHIFLSARTATVVVAAVGLAIAAVAYGSGPHAHPQTATTNSHKALAFSHCMRSHGVPTFPDPTTGGVIPKVTLGQLGVSTSEFQSAETACQRLLPTGADDVFPPGEVQQLLIGMLRFSHCMRAHGVPNWPDPTTDSEGRPVFLLSHHGFTRQEARSPRMIGTENQCERTLPGALGGVPID